MSSACAQASTWFLRDASANLDLAVSVDRQDAVSALIAVSPAQPSQGASQSSFAPGPPNADVMLPDRRVQALACGGYQAFGISLAAYSAMAR